MPRWVLSQPLLICLLTAWAGLVPAGWWLCHQHCGSSTSPDDSSLRISGQRITAALERRRLAPWAEPILDAIQSGARDALGPSAADSMLANGLPSDIAAEVRALVAARLRKSPSSVPTTRKDSVQNGKNTTCLQGRGPASFEPTAQLMLPVLDGMGGRVTPSGPVAPNMTANSWGIPMPNVTVEVAPGKILTVDEVVYGYDLLFEAMHLFSYVSWGRVPMQQDPSDALVIADLIGRLQPDCFVELGTNTGGGAVFYAEVMKAYVPRPLVVTIDVHPPTVNWDRFATKACPHCVPVTCHPAWQEPGLIEFVQGYTQEDSVVNEVERHLKSRQCKRTVVMHDSDHRGFAVERDLQIYHRFVEVGSYLIIQDTKLSRMRGGRYQTLEAVRNFLASEAGKGHFVVDRSFEYLLFSHHHSGFLKRIAA